jgi:hypothetical protein
VTIAQDQAGEVARPLERPSALTIRRDDNTLDAQLAQQPSDGCRIADAQADQGAERFEQVHHLSPVWQRLGFFQLAAQRVQFLLPRLQPIAHGLTRLDRIIEPGHDRL